MHVALKVAVLGASDKPTRYAYLAVERLLKAGHQVFPVSSKLNTVLGLNVYARLAEITEPIHTLSVYVNAQISSQLAAEILALNPKRIIFNPGAENVTLLAQAHSQGIETLEACTLVLLSTGQF